MRFTLRQLDIFAAVLTTGQIRGAAERLHLSQAAVSQAIQELAAALDVVLFERRGRALVPTPAARRLADLSQEPQRALHALPGQLHGHTDSALAGPVHIAASSTVARYLLPERLAALSAHHPALTVRQSSGNTSDVAERVAAGEADFGFIEGPAERDDLVVTRWQTDRLVLIGPPGTPPTLQPADLHGQRWVMRERGSGTRRVFEQRLALSGLTAPRADLLLDDPGAQVRSVAAGAGLACVSQAAAQEPVATGDVCITRLGDLVFERPLWRIVAEDRAHDAWLGRMIKALEHPAAFD